MEVKLLHLYYDLLNLYGEYGNINILTSHLKDQGAKVIIDKKTIGDSYNLLDYDFIYVGSGIESHLKFAINDLKNHKSELVEYINTNKCGLFTGNSIEILGNSLVDKDEKIECLGIFDFEVERLDDRKTADIIFNSKLFQEETVGFINKQGNILNNSTHLFEVEFGIGENEDNQYEGVYKNNFLSTYVIGPIFVRNPHFLKFFVKKILESKDEKFELKEITYKNEEEGYKLVLSELQDRQNK